MELTENPLKQWREDVGHSQSSLGAAIGGATDKTVRSWENSLTVIQPRYRRPLAEALGRDISEVVALVRFIERTKAGATDDRPEAPGGAASQGGQDAERQARGGRRLATGAAEEADRKRQPRSRRAGGRPAA